MSETESKAEVCFVDTNVWLYAFIIGQDRAKSAAAKVVIQRHEIVVSAQVINEVCVNLIKKAKFSEADLQKLIRSFYSRYRIAESNRELLLKASQLRESYQFSFWDSLVVASALYQGATILYSEDMAQGLVVENRLRVINPFTS